MCNSDRSWLRCWHRHGEVLQHQVPLLGPEASCCGVGGDHPSSKDAWRRTNSKFPPGPGATPQFIHSVRRAVLAQFPLYCVWLLPINRRFQQNMGGCSLPELCPRIPSDREREPLSLRSYRAKSWNGAFSTVRIGSCWLIDDYLCTKWDTFNMRIHYCNNVCMMRSSL